MIRVEIKNTDECYQVELEKHRLGTCRVEVQTICPGETVVVEIDDTTRVRLLEADAKV